jgi:hypothetical protein
MASRPLEDVANFKYLGTTLTDQNCSTWHDKTYVICMFLRKKHVIMFLNIQTIY